MAFIKENGKRFLAELVGTFILVFLAIGVHTFLGASELVSLLTYGIGVIALAYCIEGLSGCHLNPAVSVGACLNKEISVKQCVGHVVSQIIGGLVAGVIMFGVLKLGEVEVHAAASLAEEIPYVLLLDFVLVFAFVFIVLGFATEFMHTKVGALVSGLMLIVEHVIALQFAHMSVNQAISLGGIFVFGAEAAKDVWMFFVAGLAGAVCAGLLARVLFSHGHAKHEHTEGEHEQKD
jgi:aquaporin Z